jgi:two-component system NtrC family response regulator/two-component system response regulator HydG/two-component system response regulator AtoC
MATLLLISSDETLIGSVAETANTIDGLDLEVVAEEEQAYPHLGREDLLVVVYHLSEATSVTGITRLLKTIELERPSTGLMVVSDVHRPVEALALLRLGATDYQVRPLDLNYLSSLVELLTLTARQIGKGRTAQAAAARPASVAPAITPTPAREEGAAGGPFMGMEWVLEQVRRIAPRDTTILLEGETGTGKTRLAGHIHRLSPRRNKPFLVINCGALSAGLIESEMFGHVRGAFTGADTDRVGKFAAVGQGTLFLDEIDSLPIPVQAKLLRAIEERAFEAVGSNRTETMHARLIAASNRPLEAEVAAGRFRADLFYRLNVANFALPPLRQGLGLIPGLVREFIDEYAAKGHRQIKGIAPEALRSMLTHSWPGNIRELRNVIERAVALCDNELIGLDDLPPSFQRPAVVTGAPPSPQPANLDPSPSLSPLPTNGATPLAHSRAVAESGVIVQALQRHGGNRLKAAAELGISRKTLYQKLNKYGLIG